MLRLNARLRIRSPHERSDILVNGEAGPGFRLADPGYCSVLVQPGVTPLALNAAAASGDFR